VDSFVLWQEPQIGVDCIRKAAAVGCRMRAPCGSPYKPARSDCRRYSFSMHSAHIVFGDSRVAGSHVLEYLSCRWGSADSCGQDVMRAMAALAVCRHQQPLCSGQAVNGVEYSG